MNNTMIKTLHVNLGPDKSKLNSLIHVFLGLFFILSTLSFIRSIPSWNVSFLEFIYPVIAPIEGAFGENENTTRSALEESQSVEIPIPIDPQACNYRFPLDNVLCSQTDINNKYISSYTNNEEIIVENYEECIVTEPFKEEIRLVDFKFTRTEDNVGLGGISRFRDNTNNNQTLNISQGVAGNNLGGVNIGGVLNWDNAKTAINKAKELGGNYAITIVLDKNQLSETADFVKYSQENGLTPIIRMCTPQDCRFNMNGNPTEVVDFYKKLSSSTGGGFIAMVGPNEPGTAGEMQAFGYNDSSETSYIELAKDMNFIAKSLKEFIEAENYSDKIFLAPGAWNIVNPDRVNDDASYLIKNSLNLDLFNVFLLNSYDFRGRDSAYGWYGEFTRELLNRRTLKDILGSRKIIFTEFGTYDQGNEQTTISSIEKICSDQSIYGLMPFRSFASFGDNTTLQPDPKPDHSFSDDFWKNAFNKYCGNASKAIKLGIANNTNNNSQNVNIQNPINIPAVNIERSSEPNYFRENAWLNCNYDTKLYNIESLGNLENEDENEDKSPNFQQVSLEIGGNETSKNNNALDSDWLEELINSSENNNGSSVNETNNQWSQNPNQLSTTTDNQDSETDLENLETNVENSDDSEDNDIGVFQSSISKTNICRAKYVNGIDGSIPSEDYSKADKNIIDPESALLRFSGSGEGWNVFRVDTLQINLPIRQFGSNSSSGTPYNPYMPIAIAFGRTRPTDDVLNQFSGPIKLYGHDELQVYPMPLLGSGLNNTNYLLYTDYRITYLANSKIKNHPLSLHTNSKSEYVAESSSRGLKSTNHVLNVISELAVCFEDHKDEKETKYCLNKLHDSEDLRKKRWYGPNQIFKEEKIRQADACNTGIEYYDLPSEMIHGPEVVYNEEQFENPTKILPDDVNTGVICFSYMSRNPRSELRRDELIPVVFDPNTYNPQKPDENEMLTACMIDPDKKYSSWRPEVNPNLPPQERENPANWIWKAGFQDASCSDLLSNNIVVKGGYSRGERNPNVRDYSLSVFAGNPNTPSVAKNLINLNELKNILLRGDVDIKDIFLFQFANCFVSDGKNPFTVEQLGNPTKGTYFEVNEFIEQPALELNEAYDSLAGLYRLIQSYLDDRGIKYVGRRNLGWRAEVVSSIRDGGRPINKEIEDLSPYYYNDDGSKDGGTQIQLIDNKYTLANGKSSDVVYQYFDWLEYLNIFQEYYISYLQSLDHLIHGEQLIENPYFKKEIESPIKDKEYIIVGATYEYISSGKSSKDGCSDTNTPCYIGLYQTVPVYTCDELELLKMDDVMYEDLKNPLKLPLDKNLLNRLSCVTNKDDMVYEDPLTATLCEMGFYDICNFGEKIICSETEEVVNANRQNIELGEEMDIDTTRTTCPLVEGYCIRGPFVLSHEASQLNAIDLSSTNERGTVVAPFNGKVVELQGNYCTNRALNGGEGFIFESILNGKPTRFLFYHVKLNSKYGRVEVGKTYKAGDIITELIDIGDSTIDGGTVNSLSCGGVGGGTKHLHLELVVDKNTNIVSLAGAIGCQVNTDQEACSTETIHNINNTVNNSNGKVLPLYCSYNDALDFSKNPKSTNSRIRSTKKFDSLEDLAKVIAEFIDGVYDNKYPYQLLLATLEVETSGYSNNVLGDGDPLNTSHAEGRDVTIGGGRTTNVSGPYQFLDYIWDSYYQENSEAFKNCLKEIGVITSTPSSDLRKYIGPSMCMAGIKHSQDASAYVDFSNFDSESDWLLKVYNPNTARNPYTEDGKDELTNKISAVEIVARRYLGVCLTTINTNKPLCNVSCSDDSDCLPTNYEDYGLVCSSSQGNKCRHRTFEESISCQKNINYCQNTLNVFNSF